MGSKLNNTLYKLRKPRRGIWPSLHGFRGGDTETDSNGNLISNFVYANGKLVTKLLPATLYFYHTDPAGTPLAMTDSSGSVVWRGDYLPFGEENLITATHENDYKFVGKENDKETGLYYFGARYMEAMIGRFMSPDPVGAVDPRRGRVNGSNLINPQRLNRYAYSLNNPYSYVDPDGRWPSKVLFVHQASINRVLSTVPERDRNILRQQQRAMDSGEPASEPRRHTLRAAGQTPMQAWEASNNFVRDELTLARQLEKAGQHDEALIHVGNAMHTMQDATSPTHAGFQEDPRGANMPAHTWGERIDPGAGSVLDAATQRAWDIFRSDKPVPKEVLPRP